MRNILAITVLALSLVACDEKAEKVPFEAFPPELADCQMYVVRTKNGSSLTIVRCPNSVTSVKQPAGKTSKTNITVDGVEYVRKEKP